ncbi:MAG TPA: TetR/AcrR family transcriptional regulator [Candidatus Limnocylindria bacterium]|nr:TetR/AcrR family transcriptional regulator [Candidatus Limnocylindria bacterium]
MPRQPDAQLETRILDAAYQLWTRHGEKALTMRAVARTAGTSTPTVYQRFRDKRDMLELLRTRAQQNLFAALKPARTLADFCPRYFDFAVRHPHEYELIHVDWAVRFARDEPRPSFELLKQRLADRLGGSPDQYVRMALALAALVHGTAILLLTKGIEKHVARELRATSTAAFEALVEDASHHRFRTKHATHRKPAHSRILK